MGRRTRRAPFLAVLVVLAVAAACSGGGSLLPTTAPATTRSSPPAPAPSTPSPSAAGSTTAGTTSPATTEATGGDDLPVQPDLAAPPWTPTTRTEELALALAKARAPSVQLAVDAFNVRFGGMPGGTPSSLPDGDGFDATYTLGLIEAVRGQLAPEQRAVLDGLAGETYVMIDVPVSGTPTTSPATSTTATTAAGAPGRSASPVRAGRPPTAADAEALGRLAQDTARDWHEYRPDLPTFSFRVVLSENRMFDKGIEDAMVATPPQGSAPCSITVSPAVWRDPMAAAKVQSFFAHELFHCREFSWSRAAPSEPDWLIEGAADFAAFDLYHRVYPPPIRVLLGWFANAAAPLSTRSYDAWPLFQSVADVGRDPYDAIRALVASGQNDTGALVESGALGGELFRSRWSTLSFRRSAGPDKWLLSWPSPTGTGGSYDNKVRIGTIGPGVRTVSGNGSYSQRQLELGIASDVDLVEVTPRSVPTSTISDDGTVTMLPGITTTFCVRKDGCRCPDDPDRSASTIPLTSDTMIVSFAATDDAPSATIAARPFDPKVCKRRPPRGADNGDPHLTTFDGVSYDAMSPGEFVLSRDDRGGFEVQARHVAYPTAATRGGFVSAGAAVALGTGAHRITLTASGLVARPTFAVRVDGRPSAVPVTVDGVTVSGTDGDWTGRWPDGTTVAVRWTLGLFVAVSPSVERGPHLVGLLGSADRDPFDDLRGADGVDHALDPFRSLDATLVPSWRVTSANSLFDYGPGESPATFAAVPPAPPPAPADDATRTCGDRLGATATPAEIRSCAVVLTATGEASFLDAYTAEVRARVTARVTGQAAGGAGATGSSTTAPPGPAASAVAGTPVLTLSGPLSGRSFGRALTGRVHLAAGTAVVARAALCYPNVDVEVTISRRDATARGTRFELCDPTGLFQRPSRATDQVVPTDGYVWVPQEGDYDVTVRNSSSSDLMTTVALYADGTPTIVDGTKGAVASFEGELRGTGRTVVLQIATGASSRKWAATGLDVACETEAYGADPLGRGDPWPLSSCGHTDGFGMTPTGDMVISVVIFTRSDDPVSVKVSAQT